MDTNGKKPQRLCSSKKVGVQGIFLGVATVPAITGGWRVFETEPIFRPFHHRPKKNSTRCWHANWLFPSATDWCGLGGLRRGGGGDM